MVEVERQLHSKLVTYLAKRPEDEAKGALDNLVQQGLIGVREHKQLTKRVENERISNSVEPQE